MQMKKIHVDVTLQVAATVPDSVKLPSAAELKKWILKTIENVPTDLPDQVMEITVRMVSSEESADLNLRYRNKQGPTNILSFAFSADSKTETPFTGDLIICLPKLIQEAKEQNKTFHEHLVHLIVHGTLHLLGYDHIKDDERKVMEDLEDQILRDLA